MRKMIDRAIRRNVLRKKVGKAVRRFMVTRQTIRNQRRILELARSRKLIFLVPVPPGSETSSVEHYYHFIFDLVLPLYFLVKKTPPDVVFAIRNIGPFTDRLRQLFPNRVKIEQESEIPRATKKIELIGMCPRVVHTPSDALESFKKDVCDNLDVDQGSVADKILLIERLPPDPYFMTSSEIRGGGTTRRSIVNHEDLACTIGSMVRSPFEFHKIHLEKMSLKEQVHCFDSALVVFGQHGAGLANSIWMRRNSTVIELGHNQSQEHFKIVSRLKHLNYLWYETAGEHATIDIDHFVDWILGNSKLSRFFHRPEDFSAEHRKAGARAPQPGMTQAMKMGLATCTEQTAD